MKSEYRSCLFALTVGFCSGCVAAQPTESSFCALAGESWEDADEVIALLDPFASRNGYERGERSPNGILYANKRANPDWVLSISPVGPIGVEISFYPREPGAYDIERSKIEEYVNSAIAPAMSTIYCDDKQDYGKGKIYGFDGIRL